MPKLGDKAADHIAAEKEALAQAEADSESLAFIQGRAAALGMTLSLEERKLIIADADTKGGGHMTTDDWQSLVDRHTRNANERFALGQYILKTIDQYQGQRTLRRVARVGNCFFAITGANVAGEAGMHVIGSTVVGVVTGVTGGTFNAVLLGQPVAWVRDPSLLAVMIAFCMAGFYIWPLADRYVSQFREQEAAKGTLAHTLSHHLSPPDRQDSTVRYALESVALGSASVVAAQQGIVMGLHPLVSACLSISIAFGGAARDVLCHRDVRLNSTGGSQSYAVSSFAGALVYVVLRQLHVWNCHGDTARMLSGGIPIGLRIGLSIGTSCAVRVLAWQQRPDDLFWSMETALSRNEAALQPLFTVKE